MELVVAVAAALLRPLLVVHLVHLAEGVVDQVGVGGVVEAQLVNLQVAVVADVVLEDVAQALQRHELVVQPKQEAPLERAQPQVHPPRVDRPQLVLGKPEGDVGEQGVDDLHPLGQPLQKLGAGDGVGVRLHQIQNVAEHRVHQLAVLFQHFFRQQVRQPVKDGKELLLLVVGGVGVVLVVVGVVVFAIGVYLVDHRHHPRRRFSNLGVGVVVDQRHQFKHKVLDELVEVLSP